VDARRSPALGRPAVARIYHCGRCGEICQEPIQPHFRATIGAIDGDQVRHINHVAEFNRDWLRDLHRFDDRSARTGHLVIF
jgi:hypothetical protein